MTTGLISRWECKSIVPIAAVVFLAGGPQAQIPTPLQRTDTHVTSAPGVEIFVHEVRSTPAHGPHDTGGVPVILVHGGGPAGLASFDLPVPGFSVAADLATAGHVVYVMDVRGWGASTRPAAMHQPASANPPAVPVAEVVQDIDAVVEYAHTRTHAARVAILGWASGGHWAAAYASRHSNRLSHLIVLNSLYSVKGPWELRAGFEAADRPGEFDPSIGAYVYRTAPSLIGGWDRSIPTDDKTIWRDSRVAEAYVREALASDPTSATRTPPSLRTPAAFQREAYAMSLGEKLWDGHEIRVPTLILRGARDFWSRPEDLTAFERDLTNAPRVRAVTIPDGTHFLMNDRSDRGRARFLDEVTRFLANETTDTP